MLLVAIAILLSWGTRNPALASAATWWDRYQRYGNHDAKWDKSVQAAMEYWYKRDWNRTKILCGKAMARGADGPIVKYVYAHSTYWLGGPSAGPEIRKHLADAVKSCGDKPELQIVKFSCLQVGAWQHTRDRQYEEAIRTYQEALTISSESISSDRRLQVELDLFRIKGLQAMTGLKLPRRASKDQVRAYVQKIADLSQRNIRAEFSHPQYAMLERVGPQNVDVLLEHLNSQEQGTIHYYMRYTIQKLVREEHKSLILRWLELEHELIPVVLQQGWQEDAKPILVKRLAEHPRLVPTEWIDAVVRLQDPDTYEALRWYLVNGVNNAFTYESIRTLPGIQLDEAVAGLWQKTESWTGRDASFRPKIAAIATYHGVVDALGFAVDSLGKEWGRRYTVETPRGVILKHTEARGSDEELREWWTQNKDVIVFDSERGTFVVDAAAAAKKEAEREAAEAVAAREETRGVSDATSPGPQEGWVLQFEDNFEREELGPKWITLYGEWHIRDGWLATEEGPSEKEIICFPSFPGSQRLEYDAVSTDPCDLSAFICAGAGGHSSGYFFGFGSDENTRSKLLGAGMAPFFWDALIEPGKAHHIVVERDGKVLRQFVDGKKTMEQIHSEPLQGRMHEHIGFYSFRAGRFDNVRVYTKPDSGETEMRKQAGTGP